MSEHHDPLHQKTLKFTQEHALSHRTELPSELQYLLKKYPKAIWKGHPNMSNLLRFWVAKHIEFNKVCADLSEITQSFLEGIMNPQSFQQIIAPKITWLLVEFSEHHHIEDHFTFPLFRRAEPKLNKGIDILDADHIALNKCLQELTQASKHFIQCQNTKNIQKLSENFVQENNALAQLLKRHLIDEEEIVIPLFLDRGEQLLHGG